MVSEVFNKEVEDTFLRGQTDPLKNFSSQYGRGVVDRQFRVESWIGGTMHSTNGRAFRKPVFATRIANATTAKYTGILLKDVRLKGVGEETKF